MKEHNLYVDCCLILSSIVVLGTILVIVFSYCFLDFGQEFVELLIEETRKWVN